MAKPSEVEIATASSTYSQTQEFAAHAASIAAHRQPHHSQAGILLYPFTRLKVASNCTRGHAHARKNAQLTTHTHCHDVHPCIVYANHTVVFGSRGSVAELNQKLSPRLQERHTTQSTL
jgi:hypothetical protein